MTKLTEEEKRELLEDARSSSRLKDFELLRQRAQTTRLSPEDYIAFLNESQRYMKEDVKARPPIKGDVFKL